MKALQNIYSRMFERVPIQRNFVHVNADIETLPEPEPDRVRHRYKLEFWQDIVGPDVATSHMNKLARSAIARELYGEAVDDLIRLEILLMEETYRSADDKAIVAIRDLIRKMEG
jgi:hypothetical protein